MHPFQVLRKAEGSRMGVEREDFLGLLWVEFLARAVCLSTPRSRSLKREVHSGMTLGVLSTS